MFSTKYSCIIAALLLIVESVKCYPKGSLKLPRNDDQNSGEITITTTFPFFNKSFDSLFVSIAVDLPVKTVVYSIIAHEHFH